MSADLTKVALAISSHRNDASVVALLETVFAGQPSFGAVVVVDSEGSGEVARHAKRRGWPLNYFNSPENLGSAGNLRQRLEICANLGMDWCYTVNHDGVAEQRVALGLLKHCSSDEPIGAAYPAVRYSQANDRVEPARLRLSPFSPRNQKLVGLVSDVTWGSSNSALYNLKPFREGLEVWPELWMGWEDLAYGWLLSTHGWRQIRCADVEVVDDYEYQRVRLLGRDFYIADKPPWYMYYQLRNLVLIGRRSRWKAVGLAGLAARTVGDICLTALKRDRGSRISLLMRGLLAGLRGESGKGPVPR